MAFVTLDDGKRIHLIAVDVLERALTDADNLLRIHESIGTGPGRRVAEVSLNRAGVVLAIAAWQAFVERLVDVVLRMVEPREGWYDDANDDDKRRKLADTAGHKRLRANVLNERGRYSTPNAENTQRLLGTLGYDPIPNWRFNIRGGTSFTPESARETLAHWIRVRNHLAHGNPELPPVPVISRTTATQRPTIHKADAKRCIAFVRALARATEAGVAVDFYHWDGQLEFMLESVFRD